MDKYRMLPIREITPLGWLRDQLDIQLKGLSGNLDQIWPDVRDSAWIGGDREGWERVPYWLDGAIPLAFLTGDESLKQRVRRYVDEIISRQEEDGWLCPNKEQLRKDYDIWALILISKTLTVWYRCAGDERIPACLYRAMKCCLAHIRQYPLFDWGKSRWFEAFVALRLLREKYDEPWIDELARTLREQGMDWLSFKETWKRPINRWTQHTHIVNLMMALKDEAISRSFLGEDLLGEAEEILRILTECNGTAAGLITGDECLSGLSPIQGTEFCAVVEQAYSYEWLFAITGDPKWSDLLEQVVYNGFAATMTDDMWCHQYVQMANQIECVRFPGRSLFRTNDADAHIFGLEPHFGCCTANFSQGWPKFAANLFVKSEDELVNTAIAPCRVQTSMHGVPVMVALKTEYPFRSTMAYEITAEKPVHFALGIRIPIWAEEAEIDGVKTNERGLVKIERDWDGKAEVSVRLTMRPKLIDRPNRMHAMTYGPLVFSLPIAARWEKLEYIRDGVERKYPYCDWHLYRDGEFAYAIASDDFEVIEKPITQTPFAEKEPPLQIMMDLSPIDWEMEDGFEQVCAKSPLHRKAIGPAKRMALQPYGSTMLRMTELPKVEPRTE